MIQSGAVSSLRPSLHRHTGHGTREEDEVMADNIPLQWPVGTPPKAAARAGRAGFGVGAALAIASGFVLVVGAFVP